MSITKSTSNNFTFTGPKAFRCPVAFCGQRINETPRQIAEHVKQSHPTIAKKMGLQTNPNKPAFLCKPCVSYTTTVHYHCFECEHPENGSISRHFKTTEERDEHLKKDHTKWWFEYECKHGINCHGKKGGCGFNHNHFEQPYLSSTDPIPSCVCRYDRPWDGVRCYRDKCSFSHFWGRVRYLIKIRSEASSSREESTCSNCVHVSEDPSSLLS